MTLPIPAAADDAASLTQDLLAQGMWSEGRKSELEGEYGMAAMNYFKAYHLYDALSQEATDTADQAKWNDKKLKVYTDALAAVRQYEKIRGIRVDVKRLLEMTKPLLVTSPKPVVKDKLAGVTLTARSLPGDMTPPPDVDEGGLGSILGEKTIERNLPIPGAKSRTQLVVRGRKFIGWTATSTRYKKPSEIRKNSKDVKVDQQLQIQIGGNVAFQFAEALTVAVNFDDQESDQNQKQAITIKFEPKNSDGSPKKSHTPLGEMHPVAEFGDVNLILEGTSYAVYNKSLFGLTGSLTFDDFHFFDVFRAKSFKTKFIATQTKGISAHREFTGQNTLVVRDIPDITFLAKTHYDLLAELSAALKATKLPIKVGTEKLFRDDRNSATNTANTITNKKVTGRGTDTFVGDFDPLVSGQDYFIDYQLGIVQFKSSVAGGAVLAVSFTMADGTVVTDSMIKNENTTDTYKIFELKNRYSLGSTNILRNDPDFIIQIRDLNNKSGLDIDSNGTIDTIYNQIFGLDATPLDGRTDEKNIDFDFGILKFPTDKPFELTGADPFSLSNAQIYTSGVPTQKYKIHVEYVQKTNVYLLNPSIVKNSEIITIDGARMSRDLDYFIDYASGFLQFLRPELITSKSLIVVDYEYFPFTSKSNQTLIGTGLNMEISPNINWAATFVSNFDDKPPEKPKVGEEPKKIDISDFVVNFNPIGMTKNWLENWMTPPKLLDKATMNFSFENASSKFNYNTAGEAILADFEDAGQADQLGISQNQWRPEIPDRFNGSGIGSFTIGEVSEKGHLDGQSGVSSDDLRNQRSLQMPFTFTGDDSYVCVSFHISDISQDFSKKTFLEFWVKDDKNQDIQPDVTLDIGILNEDADTDGLETEDLNKDNLLNSGEDVGIVLAGIRVGTNNGILDSEDRDRDGVLDVDQAFFRANLNDSAVAEFKDFSNKWRRYRVFLGTLTADTLSSNQTADLKNIKDVRLTFSKTGIASGTLLINDISFQGVTWEDDDFKDTKTFVVGLISNRTDPNFKPPDIIAGDIQPLDAKALSLSYTSRKGQNITKFLPSADLRLSLYRKMNFWVRNGIGTTTPTNAGDTFIFRFGPDANNYFETTVVLTANSAWTEYTINLEQVNKDLIKLNLDTSPPFDVARNGMRFFGTPTLDRIHFLGAGVSSTGRMDQNQVFFDEVTVKDVEEEEGSANKTAFTSAFFDNLITLNGNQEITDNTFRPIGRINYTGVGDYVPEDKKARDFAGTVNFSRLTFLDRALKLNIPVQFTKRDVQSFINPDLVENVKRADLGNRRTDGQTIGFSVSRNPSWPSFSANWSKQNDDVNQKTFIYKQENTDKNYSVSYGKSFNRKIFWFIPIGRSLDYNTTFSRATSVKDKDIFLGTEKSSFQKNLTDNVGLNIHYTITRWFDWSFTINQSLSRQTLTETQPLKVNGRGKNYGWNWPFPTFFGLTPALNWSFSYTENFNNENELKSVNSSGNFGANVGLQPEKWWRRFKFFTISYAYNISGGASYQNLPERFGLTAVFDDFYRNIFFFWKGGDLEVTSDTVALFRNSASTSRSHSFGGSIKIWQSLSTTYNTAFNRSEVQSLNSVDLSDAFSFNLNNTLDLKTASRMFRKPNSAAVTYSYAFNSSRNKTTQSRNINNSLAWPVSWTDRLRTSLTYSFVFGDNKDRLSVTKNQNSNSAFNLSYLLSNPFKMTTFTGNLLRFENRMELTSGLTWNTASNELDGVKKNDSQGYGGNLGLVYDLRENFRINGNTSYTVNTNKITPDDNKSITAFTATAELRF